MKLKFLFCAAAAFLSAGCNDEDGSGDFGNLKFPDTGELDQTFKADQTSSRLTFEVAEAWTSEVVYGDSRADETTGWVSLSPDHGVAFDIAGQDKADPQSMRNAIYTAIDVVQRRRAWAEWTRNPLPRAEREKSSRDVSLKELPQTEKE